MTMTRDPDRLIRAFLDEGRTELPSRTYDAVRAEIDHTRQRVVVMPRITGRRVSFAAIGTAATLLLILGTLVLAVIGGGAPVAPGGAPDPAVTTTVRQAWDINSDIAVTIRRDPNNETDATEQYWRVATYDVIGVHGWQMSGTTTVDLPAGRRTLQGRADDVVDSVGLSRFAFTVTPVTFTVSAMLSPATPIEANVPSRVSLVGRAGYFARLDRDGTGPYSLTAMVGQEGTDPGQYNVEALRLAGEDYPADVRDHYLQVDPAILGPNALALKARVQAAAGARAAPIDDVESIMRELRSTAYTYTTDMRAFPCGDLSTVECFATFKQGFCQYYAPTMAVILRSLGVPTRIVEGFLPGERSGNTEIIRNSNAHAWVEVYFPGYGWIAFDPTGAGTPAQAPATLPSGS